MPIQKFTINSYPSASTRGKFYDVLLNVNQDTGSAYLSCNCPAWCRGADQKGKSPEQRTCKHTLEAQRFYSREINDILNSRRQDQLPAPARSRTITFQPTVQAEVQEKIAAKLGLELRKSQPTPAPTLQQFAEREEAERPRGRFDNLEL